MEKSILYAKIAISQKFFFPKFSFKYYIGQGRQTGGGGWGGCGTPVNPPDFENFFFRGGWLPLN